MTTLVGKILVAKVNSRKNGDKREYLWFLAKNFIDRCLTIDVNERITAQQALQHEWLAPKGQEKGGDLLPNLRNNFNARRTFKKAINMVTLSNHFGHSIKSNSNNNVPEQLKDQLQPVNEGIDQVLETE